MDLKVNSSAERSLWRGSSGLFTQKQGGSTWTVALKAPAGQRQRMKCGIREDERKATIIPSRLRRCIARINRWTDYYNNREIIVVIILDVSKTSQNNQSQWF